MNESQPCKRKRVVTACDTCRKSKIKCDGELPQCSRCARIKANCVYTPVARKTVAVKRTRLIEGLEDRLNRIESLVMSDPVSETMDVKAGDRAKANHNGYEHNGGGSVSMRAYPSRPATGTPLSAKNGSSRAGNDTATPRSETSALSATNGDAKSMDFLTTDVKGQSQYIGSASGFSIFSPNGVAWINEKVGDAQFMSVISSARCVQSPWGYPNILTEIASKRTHRRLPPKQETRALLLEYFGDYKTVTPPFEDAKFMSLFEDCFTQEYDPRHGPGWWASLNMVLATTHRIRVLNDLTRQDEEEIAWLYFKNAMAVLTELLLGGSNTMNVQALLAMALYSQGAPHVELSCFLASAAVRLSQNMGMHREASGADLTPQETQERRRLFWIAYTIDKNTSLRYGRPPVQDDDDMDVQIPEIEACDDKPATIATTSAWASTFQATCKLAVIEGKVYKLLYSVQASKQSIEEIVHTVDQLDEELGSWRQTVPEEFRPECEIKVPDDVLRLQIVNFHMAYYHCLAAIHRKLVQHGHWVGQVDSLTGDGEKEEIRKHVFSSAVLCVSAARASINLIRFIPQGNPACIWLMLCYVVMSYLALCVNIYQNPEDPKATLDLKLMKIVTNFVSLLQSEDMDPGVHHLIQICGEFERLARWAVVNAQDRRSSDRAPHKFGFSPPASYDYRTPAAMSSMIPRNSCQSELEVSMSGGDLSPDSLPLESAAYSNFGTPDPTMQRPGELVYPLDVGEALQAVGNGPEKMQFTNNTAVPEYTGGTMSSDFWQLPMPLEWNWTDMNANYFLPTE